MKLALLFSMQHQSKFESLMPFNLGLAAVFLISSILISLLTNLSNPIFSTVFAFLVLCFIVTISFTIYPYVFKNKNVKVVKTPSEKPYSEDIKLKNKLEALNNTISDLKKKHKEEIKKISKKRKKESFLKNIFPKPVREAPQLEEPKIDSKKDLATNLKKRYPVLPKDLSKRIELERFIARMIQTEKKKFSISQILSSVIKNYPSADSKRSKINTELKKWISEDPFVRQESVVNSVQYYKII
jgi:hypothetical protein